MRVAMICNYPWNPDVVPGGVTAVGLNFARGLAAVPGVELHVICCQLDVPRNTTVERDGAVIHFLSHGRRFTQLTNMRNERRRIAETIHRIQPDIIHAQGLGLPAAGALDANLPTVVTVHGIMWKEPSEYSSPVTRFGDWLRNREALSQARRAPNVFLSSGYVETVLPTSANRRTWLVNNPIGEEIFAVHNAPHAPHVLVVGGVRARKDPMTSIRVMARVLEMVPEATMHLLGVPSHTALDGQVADFISEHGLGDRIKLLGLVPNETLREEFAQASLLLIPSLEETAPVAIGEACAAGVPQVGADSGGIPWMIREGETGFVRPVGDVAGLAESVISLLTDDVLRSRMAKTARDLAEKEYALVPIIDKTINVYEEILAG